MEVLAKTWKWILTGVAVLAGLALAYFAGGQRPKAETVAAVDAARSDDEVKSALAQAEAAKRKAIELAVKSAAADSTIEKQQAAISTGVDTRAIDELLRQHGIIE